MAKSIFKCKICGEKYTSLEGLYSHLEEEHESMIPPNMSVEQYYYFLKTGKEHGKCVVCKGDTQWNEKTKKYHRFCGDPMCKAKYKETVDQRMIGKYGKVNLLNEPDHQRKMLMGRSISGEYEFNGVMKPYVGSYELDFLKTMDLFFDWDPNDIAMPSPHTYYYMYEGEKHFYIPDVFIYSLGLEIEIKDGGNNPNMHHKIQDVDKEKERLKDEVMHNQKLHHYIKLTNKNYWNLFEFFRISKEHVEKHGDYEKIPRIILDEDIGAKKISSNSRSLMKEEANKAVNENMEVVEENLIFSEDNLEVNIDDFNKHNNILYITGLGGSGKSTIISKYAEKYNAEALEFDAVTSALIRGLNHLNRNKIHPIILEYLEEENPEPLNGFSDNRFNDECVKFLDWFEEKVKNDGNLYVLEGMQIFLCFEPERFKDKPIVIMGTSVAKSMYRSVARTYRRSEGDIVKTFNFFLKTLKRAPIFVKNDRQLDELRDTVSEGFEPDKALVWLDKPIEKLTNKTIKIYHGGDVLIKGDVINPISPNVGATPLSKPRWSTYFWDNREDAMIWAVTWVLNDYYSPVVYNGHNDRTYVGKPKDMTEKEFSKYLINLMKEIEFYIYECEVNIHDLEIGSAPSIREYTVSKPVKILKRYNYHLNAEIIKRTIKIMNKNEVEKFEKENPSVKHFGKHRGIILNHILDANRDINRALIKTEVKQGNIRPGIDDISDFQYSINRHHKLGTYYLKENYNHFITLGLNKKMNRGLYGFIDNKSYILYDDKVQLKRINNVMQSLTENFELDDDIEIITFGINKDVDINLDDTNQGAFLRWNRTDDINTLLENISAEWFNSELTIDDFHRIEGED